MDGPQRTSLRELGWLFLRLGGTAFGGPAAHIAMMRDEVVQRRGWLSDEDFLDLLGATNLIPGPNSTELAIHIGWQRRRWAGLLVAGSAFILPAMLITGALGWLYLRVGSLPSATAVLYGVKPVILAIVLDALWGLAPKAARTVVLRAIGAIAAVSVVLGANEILVLVACGAAALACTRATRRVASGSFGPGVPFAPVAAFGSAGVAAGMATAISWPALFWVFFKIGSVLFGSGYVLLAFLRSDLVERLRWLTEAQLIDAVAVGQITPGPVFTTATFIGYLLGGPGGAVVATVGIFLPAFIFVALSGPLVPRLRASAAAGAFLDGVNVASLALMAVVTFQLGRAALVDVPAVLLMLAAAVVLIRFRINATWLILAGATLGWVVRGWG